MFRYAKIPSFLQLIVLMAVMTIAPAKASLIPFSAYIDGAQANAGIGTGSAATGSATMWLDDVTNDFSWTVSWSGLNSVTAAHFHGPATSAQNAGVQVPINFGINPAIGNATLTAGQASDLLAGLWYINIHTATFPGGEIRGQISQQVLVSAPGALLLLLLSVPSLLLARRRA